MFKYELTDIQSDLADMSISDQEYDDEEDEEEADDDLDPIAAERRRRAKKQDRLRRTAGEPVKPEVSEILKLQDGFLSMLRMVLSE